MNNTTLSLDEKIKEKQHELNKKFDESADKSEILDVSRELDTLIAQWYGVEANTTKETV